MSKDTKYTWSSIGNLKDWGDQCGAVLVEWDETTQTPTIKLITPQELYKDCEKE
jgi:hypothetical protein